MSLLLLLSLVSCAGEEGVDVSLIDVSPRSADVEFNAIGQARQVKIAVANRSSAQVVARLVAAKCGCLSVPREPFVVPPRETRVVEITASSISVDPQTRSIAVVCADSLGKAEATVATVRCTVTMAEAVSIRPSKVNLRLGGSILTKESALQVRVNRPFGVDRNLELSSTNEGIVAYIQRVESEQKKTCFIDTYDCAVTLKVAVPGKVVSGEVIATQPLQPSKPAISGRVSVQVIGY